MRRIHALALLLTITAAAGAVEETPFTFPRSAPEAQGISSSAILGFVDEAEQKLDALHSFMLVRHGQVVAEGWWGPYAADEPHMLFSLSKSFTSTAVGLAVADGKLKVDDPVLGFFPDEAPAQPSANLKAMRVRDLLTMSTGHHDEDDPRLSLYRRRERGEELSRAARLAQARHVLPLQHAGELHAVGHRAEGHRTAGRRLSAAAALRAARHRRLPRGRRASRASRWAASA